ncbi:hypothetical protein OG216_27560 [Streptomycetaceae bacterium NBC_01309]
MRVGDKVKAIRTITGLFRPTVPQGSVGYVTRVGYSGIEVTFTIPGVMGGHRSVVMTARRDEIGKA